VRCLDGAEVVRWDICAKVSAFAADKEDESFPFRTLLSPLGRLARAPIFLAIIQRTMISRQEVEHVARLARLHFDEEELARLQPELGQIIDYVRQLAELDLSGLEPTSHAVPLKNVLRPDEPVAGLSQAEATSNGPDVERGQFVVPRIG
jgi:aspartyl-tRNA(Asn)/glutamyl-tRNA(Gln) amidotransferase subunit C